MTDWFALACDRLYICRFGVEAAMGASTLDVLVNHLMVAPHTSFLPG